MVMQTLPYELQEFERLLGKSNNDLAGLASFFNSGEIWVARVPARLDVIGGIADYSGSNVCEGVLGRGMLVALQPRTDRTLRIRTMQLGQRSLPVETRLPLDYFKSSNGLAEYSEVRAFCQANPLTAWAAYITGSIFTVLREASARLPYGFSMLMLSAVPMNVGIGSSAAVEIGTLQCLNAYLGLNLDASRIAQLGQMAENLVDAKAASHTFFAGPDRSSAPSKSRPGPVSLASTQWCAIRWQRIPTPTPGSARSWERR